MSRECDNVTPLGAKAAAELLNENSAALVNAILDLTEQATNDSLDNPLVTLDQATLASATSDLNNILQQIPIGDLENLDQQVKEGGVSASDLAEYAISNSDDLVEIGAVLAEYNKDLPVISGTGGTTGTGTSTTGTGTGTTGTGTTGTGGVATGSGGTGGIGGISGANQGAYSNTGAVDGSVGIYSDPSGYTTGFDSPNADGLAQDTSLSTGIDGSSVTGPGTGLDPNALLSTTAGAGSTSGPGSTSGISIDDIDSSLSNSSTQIPQSGGGVLTGSGETRVIGDASTLSGRQSTPLTPSEITGNSTNAGTGAGGTAGAGILQTGDIGGGSRLTNVPGATQFVSDTGSLTIPQSSDIGSSTILPVSGAVGTTNQGFGGANQGFGPGASTLAKLRSSRSDVNDVRSNLAIYGALIDGDTSTIVPVLMYEFLQKLDFHFATNIGQKLTSGVCGAYNDILTELNKFTQVVNTGKALIGDINNLLEKDVKKLAESIKQRGVLATLMGILEKIIEGAIKAAKGVAIAAVASVLGIIKVAGSAAKAIMKKVAKVQKDINNYMKDASVQKIIEDMEKLVVKLAESFERLTPQNIANLMFRLCQMAQDLQAKLMQLALELNKFATTVGSQSRAIQSQQAKTVQSAVSYGAIRVSDADRTSKKKSSIDNINSNAPPSNTDAVYVDSKEMSENEMQAIATMDESGIGTNISFGPQLTKEDALGKQPGWQKVNNTVWMRLMRLVQQTGETYTVEKGYVSPKYVSALKRSPKVPHNTGYTIDISVTPKIRKDTIVAASRAGFTGISVYPSYITLSLSNRRAYLSPSISGQEGTDIQELLDKHNIDGFKIKRT